MTTTERDYRLDTLLARSRFEVLPFQSVTDKVDALPEGERVTITASPGQGIEATVAIAQELREKGLAVTPHLSARLIADEVHLKDLVQQLAEIGVDDVFCVGGDAAESAGSYHSGIDLMRALTEVGHPFTEVGTPAYPEGHPSIPNDVLYEALKAKQPHATYMVTQMCFDARVIVEWMASIGRRGVDLPIYVGLPGDIDPLKLMRISAKIGIGDSAKFISKNKNAAARLVNPRGFNPDKLVKKLSREIADRDLNVRGFHIYTFNEVSSAAKWRDKLRVASP